ncbi:MAG: arginine deiminase-related protein [Candidatus Bathyarchaeota archaeon]|nr:arginine deiminase-related protein [Candidatus Bathyarchaeota archaeon]
MLPKRALVREPGERYPGCISSHPLRHTVDVSRARAQHAQYCSALYDLGLEIIRVPRDDERPDSCFVEDNAVVHGGKALICRMAKESRRGEEVGVEAVLRGHVPVRRAVAPATIEGGDVIHLPDRLISGLTQRTNAEGVAQMRDWLGVPVDTVADPGIVHIKSYVTYLGKGIVIATRKYASHRALEGLEVLVVPEDEEYAADALGVGDAVFMPAGLPKAHEMVSEAGFDVMPLDVSEFEKCEGAITCLSILF